MPVRRTAAGRRRARRVIAFIQALTIPSGIGEGTPFKLDTWEKDFIRDIYDHSDVRPKRLVSIDRLVARERTDAHDPKRTCGATEAQLSAERQ